MAEGKVWLRLKAKAEVNVSRLGFDKGDGGAKKLHNSSKEKNCRVA
jgi:hypothetical protein